MIDDEMRELKHNEREALRDEIVERMHGMGTRTLVANTYRDLQAKLQLDAPHISGRQFSGAIRGSHYKRDGRLHIGHTRPESMSSGRRLVLTCLHIPAVM